jgi:uncharacterized RDD family membrane protein YckC
MDWFYADGTNRAGPISDETLRELVRIGKITATTLVWREGMSNWQPYGTLSGVQPAGSEPGTGVDLLSPVEVAPASIYGGFWIRALAKLLDVLILAVLGAIIGAAIGFSMAASGIDDQAQIQSVARRGGVLLNAIYSIFMHGTFGATLGKMACGLRVVPSDFKKIGFGRATARYFSEILSTVILFIGYIMAAFDVEKRTLHDRICDTRVIKA